MDFSSIITHWYSIHKREMPWRQTNEPYKIWLSEIILQQTQVVQGLPYYELFSENYPTVFDLASATEESVLKLWQGLGYYSRARNLHTTANYIVKEFNGVFPKTYGELIKLKGVGDYTASAIASICYNEPCAVVDGNVYRVLSRYFGVETAINSTKGNKAFKTLAQDLLDKADPATHNQAIMEFGAQQCKPKNPNCQECPLNKSCYALKEKKIDMLPFKDKKVKVTKKYFNYMVYISKNYETILEQRTNKGIWQNLYQFPLIETKKPVSKNDIEKLLNISPTIKGQKYDLRLYNEKDIVHKLSHQHLHTKFWIVEVEKIYDQSLPLTKTKQFPVPVLIRNFLEEFNL